MDIKVLGTGCTNCRTTIALIEQVAQARGVAVNLSKVEELRDIMSYGVMSTPGVVIDGKVVHAGGVPGRDKIERWLAAGKLKSTGTHSMTDDAGAIVRPSGRRRVLVVTVLGLAVAAGAMGYVLTERAAARAPEVGVRSDEVQKTLLLGKPTVVEFGANACATCRDMKPVLEALRREHGQRISVLDVDILKTRDYIARYRIQLMPTQVFFDAQGREIGRNMGKISGGEILARLGVASTERSP